MRTLVRQYVRMRGFDSNAVTKSAWRITVRQLESMIRLSEAMARLHCNDKVCFPRGRSGQEMAESVQYRYSPLFSQVTVRHVAEAARLIDKSIIRVEQPDIEMDENNENALMDGKRRAL